MATAFSTLEEVVLADAFPDVDMALRRGRPVDRDDGDRYAFLLDAQALLEAFYRRYGCELVHKSDGYFYLLPVGDRLNRFDELATITEAMRDVSETVRMGGQMSTALAHHPLFPTMVTQMVAIGEETGNLDTMLNKIADFYDQEVDTAVKADAMRTPAMSRPSGYGPGAASRQDRAASSRRAGASATPRPVARRA